MSIFNFSYFLSKSQSFIEGKKQAFLLLEAAIGLFLAGLLSIMLGLWYINIIEMKNKSINRLQALIIATSCLEEIYANKAISSEQLINEKYKVSIRKEDKLVLENFNVFTVSVEWRESNTLTSVTLTSGFVS